MHTTGCRLYVFMATSGTDENPLHFTGEYLKNILNLHQVVYIFLFRNLIYNCITLL